MFFQAEPCETVIAPEFQLLLSVTMPSLTELSVYGKICAASISNSVQAPRLRRLHIAKYLSLPDDLTTTTSQFALNLTHLCILGVSGDLPSGGLLRALMCFVLQATVEGHKDEINSKPGFPRTLQKIVTCQQAEYAHREWGAYATRNSMVLEVEQLVAGDTSGKISVSQIPPYRGAPVTGRLSLNIDKTRPEGSG